MSPRKMVDIETNGLTDRQSLRNFDLSFGFKGLTYKTRVYSVDTPSHVYILHIHLGYMTMKETQI
jgi:hypothetical protein